VTEWLSRYRGRFEVEVVLAFVVGVAAFVLAALVSAAARSHVPSVLLGAFFILVVVEVARYGGILYALPVGVVSLQAFDWYFLPPLRNLDTATLFVLGLFLLMSVLVGAIAVAAGRRAAASEGALNLLADEQAALRRVATLVAQHPSPSAVFAAVTEEVGRLLQVDLANLYVYEGDGTGTVIAAWSRQGAHFPVGMRLSFESDSVAARAFRTQRPARMDNFEEADGATAEFIRSFGVRSSVGTPIVVEGRFWGLMTAGSMQPEPLPAGTEWRIAEFTELVATAISNAEARKELERVAGEQAALGRVATLVAEAVPSTEIFAAVAAEVAGLFGVPLVGLFRYETDSAATLIAGSGNLSPYLGRRWSFPPDDQSLLARLARTGRPLRIDDYSEVTGAGVETANELGVGAGVGVPVIVDGRIWGAVALGVAKDRPPLPGDTVERVTDFTDLVATAIANAEARTELTASRARVVAAGDETRRRLERDLHDGIQQRLVSLALKAHATEAMRPRPPDEVREELALLADGIGGALDELREISRGIHPAIVSEAGLGPALKSLARRCAVPVTLDLKVDSPLEQPLEVAAYYVASEALTNAVKHAEATGVELHAECNDGAVTLLIRDDGVGGVDPGRGSGIIGLRDRVEALGGTISIVSPVGEGTTVQVDLPPDPGSVLMPPATEAPGADADAVATSRG
jgi:signal transduction histidine kinase